MRDNTTALRAMPYYKIEPGTKGKNWAVFTAPSVSEFMRLVRDYAQTSNENWGSDSAWIGLAQQTRDDFMASGIAQKPLNDVKAAIGKLPHKHSAFARPVPAITGALWDVPSVLANVPLAARARQRQKLPPLNIRLACFWSAGISPESLAEITAKLAKAIHDYTMAGGAVNLTVGFITDFTDTANGVSQCFAGCRVNAADMAAVSTILSPVGFRALGGRMLSALCERAKNPTRGFNTDEGLAHTLFMNGCLEQVFDSAKALLKTLEIA